jgi:hypothetical protein
MLEISKLMLTDMHSFDIDNACCVDEAFKKQATGERKQPSDQQKIRK